MPSRGGVSRWTVLILAGCVWGEARAQQAVPMPSTLPPPPSQMPLGEAATGPSGDVPMLPGMPAAPGTPSPLLPQTMPSEETADNSRHWFSGLFADGEYLYLKPHSQSMDYAIANPSGGNVPDGNVISRDGSWRSAFRVGLGYRLPGQGWGLGFYYTYLHDPTFDSVAASNGGTLFATLTHPGTVAQVDTASAATSLNYNVFDVELGRWCCLTNNFAVRFFAGGRFAKIDQNFDALYNGGDANQDQVSRSLHFNGGGFRVGVDAAQTLFWGLSLFARANASLVGGEFHSTLLETNNAGATTLTNFGDRFEKVVPVTEMTMGVGWQYSHLRLSAGYTFINWFGLVNVPNFVDDAHQGKYVLQTSDLSLEGLILRAEWWF